MNGRGKSDRPIVPRKPANKDAADQSGTSAERVEGRGLAKGNSTRPARDRTQCRGDLQSALSRIREAACRDRKEQFTALWHHVYDLERLRAAYQSLKRDAAAGIDGETWCHYGEDLEVRLQDLCARLRRGAYRAKPVRRVYIPKPDGRERPIGIPTLEDKIVQRSATEVLNAVYETDFVGFSYGFRPGRGPHDALDALTVGLTKRKVNWVLDADIRGFFDTIDHGWLMKFIEHRIADRRVLRHVRKWLNAGVLESGRRTQPETGTPQGGSISPLLANIYLHYVFDLWADQWRRTQATGDVIIVRYADDFVVGFQSRTDAEQFLTSLRERLRQFKLELHDEKTRLLEFGRFAAERRARRGENKPATFDFLGFTHICSRDRAGRFVILRQTMRKRMQAKLQVIKRTLRRHLHKPISEMGRWLRTVLTGYYRYFGVPRNIEALAAFRYHLIRIWCRVLRRRSQKHRITWARMVRIANRWLPLPHLNHPYPDRRFYVRTQGRSPVR